MPDRLASISDKCFTSTGPFPIRHPDLFHNNVIVTKSFDVLGIIDWESASTMPWELIDFPCFLQTVPPIINPPDQYNELGQPYDIDEIGRWADEDMYVAMIEEAEHNAGTDSMLSQTLGNRGTQELANVIHLYERGKIGLYGRALDSFESR